jgi:hypothetical protein
MRGVCRRLALCAAGLVSAAGCATLADPPPTHAQPPQWLSGSTFTPPTGTNRADAGLARLLRPDPGAVVEPAESPVLPVAVIDPNVTPDRPTPPAPVLPEPKPAQLPDVAPVSPVELGRPGEKVGPAEVEWVPSMRPVGAPGSVDVPPVPPRRPPIVVPERGP